MTETEQVKPKGPSWQDDPGKKKAAAAKRAATIAAKKEAKQAKEAKTAARKAQRAQPAEQRSSVAIPLDDALANGSGDFLTRVRGEFAAEIENANADIEERQQTLESAEAATAEAREGLTAATAARDLIAAKLAAMEGAVT